MTEFRIDHWSRKNGLGMTTFAEDIDMLVEYIKIAFESPGWDKVTIEPIEANNDG